MATLGAFLTVEPMEPITPSQAKALYRWIRSIQRSDTEDAQATRLSSALDTIITDVDVDYPIPDVGLYLAPKWDLRKARVVDRPLYTDTNLFQSLSANRRERDDKASVSGKQSMKRKAAAIQESGLRLPDICLVGKTHQVILPSQSSTATASEDEPPRKRSKHSTSSVSVQRCGPHETALPAWILEYKPRVDARLARACFGKTSLFLAACFEMAGTFLATAMAGQYFIRLLALGERHLAVEIDFEKWPECPRQATLSELLQRRDIAKAFFAGHCLDVTREFDAQSKPVFSPNSAVRPFFEPILLAYDLLKDKPSDQLMMTLHPPEKPDDLWTQSSEWKPLLLSDPDLNSAAYYSDPRVYKGPPKGAADTGQGNHGGDNDGDSDEGGDGDGVGDGENDGGTGAVDPRGRYIGGRLGGSGDSPGGGGSSSQQPSSGPRDSSDQHDSMAHSDVFESRTHLMKKAALGVRGSGEPGGPVNVLSLDASGLPEPRVTPSPTSRHTTSKRLSTTLSSSTRSSSAGSSATIDTLSSAPSSTTPVPEQLSTPDNARHDACQMPADLSASSAEFVEDCGSSCSTGLSKGQDNTDSDDLCLGASAAALNGDEEDEDEEDEDADFSWDPAPGDDIKVTAVSPSRFQELLQCARDRLNKRTNLNQTSLQVDRATRVRHCSVI